MKTTSDVFESLYLIRTAFLHAGLSPPSAIVLATHADGMNFLSAVRDSGMMVYAAPSPHYKPIMHPDGSMWMEAEFAGMKVHWPANRWATEAGGYVYG